MIRCNYCYSAIKTRGERLIRQELTDEQLQAAVCDDDGEEVLECQWCEEEKPVSELVDIRFG